jgi:hypothetical protein
METLIMMNRVVKLPCGFSFTDTSGQGHQITEAEVRLLTRADRKVIFAPGSPDERQDLALLKRITRLGDITDANTIATALDDLPLVDEDALQKAIVELDTEFVSAGKPALPKLPGMASGGIVTRPTPTWIGEKGPEAVIPLNRLIDAVNPWTGSSTPGIEPYARMSYAGAGIGRVARAGNKSLVVHYAPVVHLHPGADHSQVEVFRRMMHAHSRELFEIINRQLNLEFRDRLMGY